MRASALLPGSVLARRLLRGTEIGARESQARLAHSLCAGRSNGQAAAAAHIDSIANAAAAKCNLRHMCERASRLFSAHMSALELHARKRASKHAQAAALELP